MKQTAVEFLIKEFSEILGPIDTKPMQDLLMMDAMKRAKEMEKQQIIESYCQGCYDITKDDSIFPREKSEQYYNETFNK